MSLQGFLITIVLLGTIQGFVMSSLLFRSRIKKLTARLLGTLIFLIALASLNIYLNTQAWFVDNPTLQILHALVPWVMVMPMGPLIYFYLRSNLEPGKELSGNDKKQFYPVLLDIVPQVAVLLFLVAVAFGFPKNAGLAVGRFVDTYNVYVDIPRWLSMSYYILLSYKYLDHPNIKKNVEVIGNQTDYKWLRQFIRLFIGFQIIWLCHLVPYIIPATRYKLLDAVDWYPVYVPLTILIYVLGIRGYLQLQNITRVKKEEKISSLPNDVIAEVVPILRNSMEQEKLYLDPALSLGTLSKHTGIAPKTISAVLNQHLQKSFNEFINEYRIAEIKERLLQSDTKNLTIAGLAYECGFNSQATFQRSFKSIVGVSPTEFMTKAQKTL
ncbi:MAG: helix-turn-helix domain-containing protein [Ferruginibacter sp.]